MKTYRKQRPRTWWFQDWHSIKYILKQLSGVSLIFAVLLWTSLIIALESGAETFEKMLGILKHPVSVGLHIPAIILSVFHTWTWFGFFPKIIPPEKLNRIHAKIVVGAWYAIAVCFFLLILWKGGIL